MSEGESKVGHGCRPSAAGLACGARHDIRWSTRPDEELLAEHARQGRREAFEELVHRYERPLYAYLCKYLRNASLAEDAFQAAWLEVHLRRREFDPRRRFRPWLYRIATTRAIDLFRRHRRHERNRVAARRWGEPGQEDGQFLEDLPDARASAPWAQLETAEDQVRLRSLIASLPARLRDVLVLILVRGLAYQEAADALGVPLGTVKSRLHEARLDLQKLRLVTSS